MTAVSVTGFELVSHVLTLGYAAMAAGILYFAMTMRQTMPKYRISSVLSVVVMVSALLLLYAQKLSWTEAHTFNGTMYELNEGAALFTNGYRQEPVHAPVLHLRSYDDHHRLYRPVL
jgi:hypothetical protein